MSDKLFLLGECNRVMFILEQASRLSTLPIEQLRRARESIEHRKPPPPGAQTPLDLEALQTRIRGVVDAVIAQPMPSVNLCLLVHGQVAAIALELM